MLWVAMGGANQLPLVESSTRSTHTYWKRNPNFFIKGFTKNQTKLIEGFSNKFWIRTKVKTWAERKKSLNSNWIAQKPKPWYYLYMDVSYVFNGTVLTDANKCYIVNMCFLCRRHTCAHLFVHILWHLAPRHFYYVSKVPNFGLTEINALTLARIFMLFRLYNVHTMWTHMCANKCAQVWCQH